MTILKPTTIKRYSELRQLNTFEERFNYLKLHGNIGSDTFGFDRYLNQRFYKSKEWKDIRNQVIIRDGACDLGIPGREINGKVYIHHLNPIDIDDIEESSDFLLNPDNLICVSLDTHNAIHYGDESYIKRKQIIERTPNDTCPWKK